MMIEKRRKIKIAFATIVSIAVISALVCVVVKLFNKSVIGEIIVSEKKDAYTTKEVKEYGIWQGHADGEEEGFFSGLFIFPEKISEEADNIEYAYDFRTAGFDNSYTIYLRSSYPADAFEQEVKRLSNITCEVKKNEKKAKSTVNKIVYSEDKFLFPAYVAVYANHDTFEYALCDDETYTITYVYLQLSDGRGLISDKLLPINEEELENSDSGDLNIYYTPLQDGSYMFYRD